MIIVILIALVLCAYFFYQKSKTQRENEELQKKQVNLEVELLSLAKYKDVRDAAETAEKLRASAKALHDAAELEVKRIKEAAEQEVAQIKEKAGQDADAVRKEAGLDAKTKKDKADVILADAGKQASQIIKEAHDKAEGIAGDALRALREADELTAVATAMQNVIEGYGDKYLKPTFSLLDELAETYGWDEAGKELKAARERSQLMVEHGRAAVCDYVEQNRKDTAIRFVVDAFNGKVDSILSRTKADNHGTLEQQIKDAYALVNNNGAAFRNAKITPEYLDSRLSELKWASSVQALKEREKEEQRRIREQMREEEKARREIDRALKDAEKEQEMLHKAMEKVQAQAAQASEAKKVEYDKQIADLQQKLKEAESKNQRALSMAQQTKSGHVYVVSNTGSFGENVYKLGMTRRLDPVDRVRELSDASVPFAFDVHSMIWSEDAPKLEKELHRTFFKNQVNKVNPRKEFFRISIKELREKIESMGYKERTSWTMAADAAEYRETLAIEAALKDNTPAAQAWIRQQIEFKKINGFVEEAEEEAVE